MFNWVPNFPKNHCNQLMNNGFLVRASARHVSRQLLPVDKFWRRLTKLGGMALELMGEVLGQSRGPVPLQLGWRQEVSSVCGS